MHYRVRSCALERVQVCEPRDPIVVDSPADEHFCPSEDESVEDVGEWHCPPPLFSLSNALPGSRDKTFCVFPGEADRAQSRA
jgi:hypothetical protein